MPADPPQHPSHRDPVRTRLLDTLHALEPWDDQERAHLKTASQWADSGAPLHRTRKPDVPAMHLVSYFAVQDEARQELLLVAHRKAGLWLPAGGHVEPGEDPWNTVVRESREELHTDAAASPLAGEQPLFVTVTPTRGPGSHTDVSLWYLLSADRNSITSYDEREFDGIRWLTEKQVLIEPSTRLDPHMHRFIRKLQHRRSQC
ncbi:NUDIX domain-containing protein [Streptomyces sp. NPDC102467]|uniref:NUDIX domain-containing protein n=1 Tax=Streptomyces sp. NPDC102467 TaxID=3366179 RepID=UPI003827F441